MPSLTTSLPRLASYIDHSLLHPTLTDAEILSGLDLAKAHSVAAACIKPYSIPLARKALAGSPVRICSVIGFPHGNSTTAMKLAEAKDAMLSGAHEIDMVVNVGKVLSGDWEYVRDEIFVINRAVTSIPVDGFVDYKTGLLKVIFENDFLGEEQIVRLCEICTEVGVAYVKTSTGYGFVKQAGGGYLYRGATPGHLRIMRERCGPGVKIKAAGGVRMLDELLYVVSLGVERVGATATVEILEEARRRGVGEEEGVSWPGVSMLTSGDASTAFGS
ncbi:deoxyribose-phosphate aldolase [Podospora aff. communis PSN243]|uniref:deoxyribose-phosphate aldolase n=1 Tax=Podospora aff. communis PSN243 TaxID=3040156 RepID=A0AAV9GDL2_9PEZI|nr:deoxyribose-phosphate aldolase [Podospora aff. communis PSN243]